MSSNSDEFDIFLANPNIQGKQISLHVTKNTTFKLLKVMLYNIGAATLDNYYLKYNDKIVKDDETLEGVGMRNGETLYILLRNLITITVNSDNYDDFSLQVSEDTRVSEVKKKIAERFDLYEEKIDIFFGDDSLEDDCLLSDVGVSNTSCISFCYYADYIKLALRNVNLVRSICVPPTTKVKELYDFIRINFELKEEDQLKLFIKDKLIEGDEQTIDVLNFHDGDQVDVQVKVYGGN